MKVVKVTRTEFELENGDVFPIIPPLEEDLTPDEFQEHYDKAVEAVRGSTEVGNHSSNLEGLGQRRKDPDDS